MHTRRTTSSQCSAWPSVPGAGWTSSHGGAFEFPWRRGRVLRAAQAGGGVEFRRRSSSRPGTFPFSNLGRRSRERGSLRRPVTLVTKGGSGREELIGGAHIQDGQNRLFLSQLKFDGWISGWNGTEGKILEVMVPREVCENSWQRGLMLIFLAYKEFMLLFCFISWNFHFYVQMLCSLSF
jgi:hypothetical protein